MVANSNNRNNQSLLADAKPSLSSSSNTPLFNTSNIQEGTRKLPFGKLPNDDQLTNLDTTGMMSPLANQSDSANLDGAFDSKFTGGFTISGSPTKHTQVVSKLGLPIKEATEDQETSHKRLLPPGMSPSLYSTKKWQAELDIDLNHSSIDQVVRGPPMRCPKIQRMMDQ